MIKVSLLDVDTYRIKVLSGPSFDRDISRLQEIPTYKQTYVEDDDGVSMPSGYTIPRIDLQEIIKLFKPKELFLSKSVKADLKLYRRLLDGANPENAYKGKIRLKGTTLWDHQDVWVRKDWDCNRLFNDMPTGAGKTMASLARTHLKGAKRTLIVTIKNVWMDWTKEIIRLFGAVPLEYKGTPAKRKKLQRLVKDHQFVIASYSLAHELNGYMYDAFIFDEQDLLANPETLRCRQLQPIFDSTWSSPRNQVIVQTATMTGNTPSTAYMAFWLIHPLLAGSFASFKSRHEKLIEFEYKTIPVKGKDGSVRWLNKRIEKKIKFVNKEQLVDTFKNYSSSEKVVYPFKHIKRVQMLEMTDGQQEVYDELKEKLESYIGRRHVKVKDIRTKMLRLLQASEGLFNFDPECLESSKLDFVREFLDRTSHKVLLWSRFRPIGDILGQLYSDRGVVYNGGLSEADRFINRIAFNGVSNKQQRKEYEKLVEAKQMADLRAFLRENEDTGLTENDYRPRFKIFEPGEAQFVFGILHTNTSRGTNFQAADYALYTTMSFSGYAMVQTDGRHARFDSKHKKIYSKYLLNYGTGEDKMKTFIEDRLMDMKLTSDGNEKISVDDAKQLAKIMIRGD